MRLGNFIQGCPSHQYCILISLSTGRCGAPDRAHFPRKLPTVRLVTAGSNPVPYGHSSLAFHPLYRTLAMTTIISDDELFVYAERAKGKVVVLTGTSHILAHPIEQRNGNSPLQEVRTVSERKWPWLSQSTGESYGQLPRLPVLILPFSAKVVIGDLDVAGAEAVVATITKNGGCVTLTIRRGKCLTDPFLTLTEERPHPPSATSSAGAISFPSSNLRLSAMGPLTLWSVCLLTASASSTSVAVL